MADFILFPHEVENPILFAQAKVEIDFRAAVMQVRRHGVPHTAGIELGQAQQKLAGLNRGGHDILVDHALIGFGQGSTL